MPHVSVKLYPGPSEDQKVRLAQQLVKDVMAIIGSGEASVSVAIEEVGPRDWPNQVYQPEIADKWALLYKKPGYNPFE